MTEPQLSQLPDSLTTERHGEVLVVRLSRVAKRNALDDRTVLGLERIFTDPPDWARAAVLAADGDHFCAGLDLAELTERDTVAGLHHSRMWHGAFARIERGRLPVVAVLRGAVIGGGLELAAACHVRVAEPSAFYALPEGQRGLFVGGGASVRVPRLVGTHRMLDMMLTGRVYGAEEGHRVGFAQYLVGADEGFDHALALAEKMATVSPVTTFAVLQALPRIGDADPDQGFFIESLMAAVAGGSEEAKTRMQDFLEGRAAKVRGPMSAPAAQVIRDVAPDWRSTTRIGDFVGWLGGRGVEAPDYDALWAWSVEDLDGFWSALWAYFDVESDTPTGPALAVEAMPGASWFPGAQINYARQALRARDVDPDAVAVIGYSQSRDRVELTWAELRDAVARARAGLAALGVRRGDRVAAYLPNVPETVVAYLATASLGAIWASCAPELGPRSVVDRLGQVDPVVLLVVDGYRYGDKVVDRRDAVAAVRAELPSVRHVVHVPYGGHDLVDVPDVVAWADLVAEPAEPAYEPVPFDHPLCVLFSSGTTGRPKAIVHGHGGLVLEHLKNHALSWDLGPGDRLMWFCTTTWMVWNALVSGLLVEATIVLVDGNPMHPDLDLQWGLAAEAEVTMLGLSPAFLMASRRAGLRPAEQHDLSRLRQIGAAGSPLPADGYHWVAEQLDGVLLNVGSGGTDVCSGLVQGSPLQPVVAGEIAGPCLGVAAYAFDESGRRVVGELGELVICRPMPSMPVFLWGDPDGSRYRDTYFDAFPGVWRHGDWVRFAATGSCVIAGRSDATLNRGGVRLGTSEFYDVLAALPEVTDSLVVHLEDPAGGNGELIVFVELATGHHLDDALLGRVGRTLRESLSPRHVPDRVVAVPAVPVNRTGKKLEVPVKRLLQGSPLDRVVAPDTVLDAAVWEPFVALAEERR